MLITAQDLVKKSANLYKDNFKLFLELAILVTLPSITVSVVVTILKAIFAGVNQEFFVVILYNILFLVLSVISAILVLWFSIVTVRIIAARYEKKDTPSISSYLHTDKKLILPVIGASILSGIIIVGGFILLIVPGIIFAVWFAFVMYAVALDGKDSVSSLTFSKNLVKGKWWATLWRLIVPAAVYIVGTYLLQTPISIILNILGSSLLVSIIAVITTYIINTLFTPFLVASQVILYLNLKSTKVTEGDAAAPKTVSEEPPF